jgi:acylphosphatase
LPELDSVNLLRMNGLIGRKYVISGRVQGVGFRYHAQRAAQELGVTGWARNLEDGRVEVQGNGTVEGLNEFEARLRKGPMGSDVRGFETVEVGVMVGEGFRIR